MRKLLLFSERLVNSEVSLRCRAVRRLKNILCRFAWNDRANYYFLTVVFLFEEHEDIVLHCELLKTRPVLVRVSQSALLFVGVRALNVYNKFNQLRFYLNICLLSFVIIF